MAKMKMNPVVHFELPAKDKKRIGDFYTRAFGWKMKQLGPEFGDYIMVDTAESDEKGPLKPGSINGGIFMKTKDADVPSVVISVDDIFEHMNTVEKAGGKVLGGQKPGEPDNIPGVGLYCAFIDTEGNRIGMMQSVEVPSDSKVNEDDLYAKDNPFLMV